MAQNIRLFKETFMKAPFDFLKTSLLKTVIQDLKNVTLQFFPRKCFYVTIITKTHNAQFKKNFVEAFLGLKKMINSRKLTKTYKNYKKTKKTSMKLSLKCLKICTMSFCDKKNLKVAFFDSHIVCNRIDLKNPNGACMKVPSNHLKFSQGFFFCGICQM